MLGFGEVPERPKGVDCKSIGYAFAGSNPALATKLFTQPMLALQLGPKEGLKQA